MEKFKNITEYLEESMMTKEDLKSMIADAAILLATDCVRNFDGEPMFTERVVQPIYFLNDIIDKVE